MAPRPRSARWLAGQFGVSSRTIERDLSALQQAGVPIWAESGRAGGYCIDPSHTLAPLGFTVDEALAVTIALGMLSTSPFRKAAASALGKVVAVMDERSLQETAELAAHIHLLDDGRTTEGPPELARALRSGSVLQVMYRDRNDAETAGSSIGFRFTAQRKPGSPGGSASHWRGQCGAFSSRAAWIASAVEVSPRRGKIRAMLCSWQMGSRSSMVSMARTTW